MSENRELLFAMPTFRPGDILKRSRAQVVELPDRRLLVRYRHGLSLLPPAPVGEVRSLLDLADGRRVGEVLAALGDGGDPELTTRRLASLAGDLLEVHRPEPARETVAAPGTRLAVVGNGPSAGRLRETLSTGLAGAPLREITVASFAACDTTDFLAADARIAVYPTSPQDGPPDGLEKASASSLEPLLGDVDLVVCVLENVPWRALWDVQAACLDAGTPALFLTFDPDGARVGPTVVPGSTPCLACAQAAGLAAVRPPAGFFDAIAHFRSISPEPDGGRLFSAAAASLLREARRISNGEPPELVARVVLFTPAGRRHTDAVAHHPECPLCGSDSERGAPPPSRSRSPLAERTDRVLIERFETVPPRRGTPDDDPERVRRVGIVGGGSAGYLAALALRVKRPELDVTLIESRHVPIIGVGEATTPLMPQFLHADLGFDVHELFREVEPTFKLGIRFAWEADGTPFNYPFGPLHVLEPAVYDGGVERCSLRSMMMSAGVLPAGGRGHGRALDSATAYHLDNRRFVHYLQKKAEQLGVPVVDARIEHVDLGEDGLVRGLRSDDGRTFTFDLYVDCTGFRSLLLEKALGSPFVSFRESLATDRALIADVPHGGRIAPYTLAEAMDAGWCWSTPQRDCDHRGYVFCSDFVSPETAEEEMRRKNPGMGEARLIEFRAGRHEHFWRGNVVALGNAYGFVEPLESTALHLLIRQIGMLCRAFPLRRGESGGGPLLNRRVNDFWDYLRWFLALHYRFNRGYEAPFWRCCREHADVSSHAELLAAFERRGPLSCDAALTFDYPDPLWGAEGVDVLLLGQRAPTRLPVPARSRAQWREHVARCERVVAAMSSQAELLDEIERRPEILEEYARTFRAIGPAFPIVSRAPSGAGA